MLQYRYGIGDVMHSALLSEKDRRVLAEFLETGIFPEKDRMLKSRAKKYYSVIKADFELLDKAMQKLGDS